MEAEEAGRGGDDRCGDFDTGETGVREVMVERGGEAAAAEPAKKDGTGGGKPEKGEDHRLGVGALEAERLAQVQGALNPVGIGSFSVQHPEDEALAFSGDGDVVALPLFSEKGGFAGFGPAAGVAEQAGFVGLLPGIYGVGSFLAVSVHWFRLSGFVLS